MAFRRPGQRVFALRLAIGILGIILLVSGALVFRDNEARLASERTPCHGNLPCPASPPILSTPEGIIGAFLVFGGTGLIVVGPVAGTLGAAWQINAARKPSRAN
jgi:hypothetical protein